MWFPKQGEVYYYPSCPPVTNIRSTGTDQHWATCAALGLIVKTEGEAQRLFDEAKEKARRALEPEPWVPTEQGQFFFYATEVAVVMSDRYKPRDLGDESLIKAGNCFETEQECRECMEAELKTRQEVRMKQAKRRAGKNS